MNDITFNIIISQIIGILAIIIFSLSTHQKTKKKVLTFQIISSVLYALQYLLLQAYSAVSINIIGLVKECLFYSYARKDKDIPITIFVIYIVLISVAGILTYDGIISLLPIILAIIMTWGSWQNNLDKYRIIAIINFIVWLIYNLSVKAYVGVIGNIFQLISAIIAVIRLNSTNNSLKRTK